MFLRRKEINIDEFLRPGSRGHGYVVNFHRKYFDVFRGTDLENQDAFINEVYIGLSSIREESIREKADHYLMKAVYFRCWRLFEDNKAYKQSEVPASRAQRDNEDDDAVTRAPSTTPLPDSPLLAQDLLEHIHRFRMTLNSREIVILNGLIDEMTVAEIARKAGITINYAGVLIHRVREALHVYLEDIGYFKKNKKKL